MSKTNPRTARKRRTGGISRDLPLVEHARDMYLRLIGAVNAKIAAGDANTTLLREAASVMRAAATLDGEQRKAEEAKHRRTSTLNKPLVVEWVRQLDATERARFLRELQAIDGAARRSGLA